MPGKQCRISIWGDNFLQLELSWQKFRNLTQPPTNGACDWPLVCHTHKWNQGALILKRIKKNTHTQISKLAHFIFNENGLITFCVPKLFFHYAIWAWICYLGIARYLLQQQLTRVLTHIWFQYGKIKAQKHISACNCSSHIISLHNKCL